MKSGKVFFAVVIALIVLFLIGCSFYNPYQKWTYGGNGADVDLSEYYNKIEIDTLLAGYVAYLNSNKDVGITGLTTLNSLNINSVYTLPTTDGSSDYVLKTDGSGNLNWQPDTTGGGSVWSGAGDIYYTGGNVGIGETNPSTALEVDGTVTATAFSGNGSLLTSLNAANITTGVLSTSRIPNLSASKITSGVFTDSRLPESTIHDTSDVTLQSGTGTFSLTRSGMYWIQSDGSFTSGGRYIYLNVFQNGSYRLLETYTLSTADTNYFYGIFLGPGRYSFTIGGSIINTIVLKRTSYSK